MRQIEGVKHDDLENELHSIMESSHKGKSTKEIYSLLVDYAQILLPFLVNIGFKSASSRLISEFIWDRFEFFRSYQDEPYIIRLVDHPMLSEGKYVGIELVIKDRPFIIDSFYNLLDHHGFFIKNIMHPISSIISVDDTWLRIVPATAESSNRRSHVYAIFNHPGEVDWDKLILEIKHMLNHLIASTDDFGKIKNRLEFYSKPHLADSADESQTILESERQALFRWYLQGNLIFFGYTEISEANVSEGIFENNLGWAKYELGRKHEPSFNHLHSNVKFFVNSVLQNSLVEIDELNYIHKTENLILAMHKVHDENFQAKIVIIVCAFSNKSINEYILNIPIVRLKISGVIDRLGMLEGSHNYKAAVEYFNRLPRHELFRVERDEMIFMFSKVQYIWHEKELILESYLKINQNYLRLVVLLPKEKMSAEVNLKIQQLLERHLQKPAKYVYSFIYKQQFHLHYTWYLSQEKLNTFNEKEVLQMLQRKLKTWDEAIDEQLSAITQDSPTQINQTILGLASEEYKISNTPDEAIADISKIAEVAATSKLSLLFERIDSKNSKFNLYSLEKFNLRDLFLKFDSIKVEATKTSLFAFNFENAPIYLNSFILGHDEVTDNNFASFKARISELLRLLVTDKLNTDMLYGLAASTELDYNKIRILQALRNYLCLVVPAFNQLNIGKFLLSNPLFATSIVEYFTQKFSNSSQIWENEDHLQEIKQKLLDQIAETGTLQDESISTALFDITQATVRTTYFQNPNAVVLKIDCAVAETIPRPRPFYEIFQFQQDLEGVHLRASSISRGGLRISDRMEDYRTEIFGLMSTQVLKNSIIVPSGAKGGFIVRKNFISSEQAKAELPGYYKRYITNLLEITDNIEGSETKHPAGLAIYDKPDPYLVVAADKGTASYSDYANEISIERGFWLGDAFASGGQSGYNHKTIGITARGAFVCLQTHLKELSLDLYQDSFSMVGIGDMSGDVFGNGLLLAPKVELLAAFNHLHIFIDPKPDIEAAREERQRLFDLPYSTWESYDLTKISQGGGIFKRDSKSIKLSAEIMALLKTTEQTMSGVELIHEILSLQVDVLFNGGIGTYVKASTETNAEAGDKTNDSVRVNANEVKAKIISEGGNLGVTQRGRIEFASLGGLINSDAIDNSAGVDLSDHEVNLKILLNLIVEKGEIDREERQELLNSIVDEVIANCLHDNQLQSYRLVAEKRHSIEGISFYTSELEHLEYKTGLVRAYHNIPSNDWLLENSKHGKPIPIPVLAVLLSLAKNYVSNSISRHDVVGEDDLAEYFVNYFPKQLRAKFDIAAINHPLRKEIINCVLTNKFVSRCGITFLNSVHHITSRSVPQIIKAYIIVADLFPDDDFRDLLFAKINNIELVYLMTKQLELIAKERVVWILANYDNANLQFSIIPAYKKVLQEYLAQPAAAKFKSNPKLELEHDMLITKGVDAELVKQYIDMLSVYSALEISYIKLESGLSFGAIEELMSAVEAKFNFNEIVQMLYDSVSNDEWQKSFVGSLLLKTNKIKRSLYRLITSKETGSNPQENLADFVEQNLESLTTFDQEWKRFLAQKISQLEGISVLLERLERIITPS